MVLTEGRWNWLEGEWLQATFLINCEGPLEGGVVHNSESLDWWQVKGLHVKWFYGTALLALNIAHSVGEVLQNLNGAQLGVNGEGYEVVDGLLALHGPVLDVSNVDSALAILIEGVHNCNTIGKELSQCGGEK